MYFFRDSGVMEKAEQFKVLFGDPKQKNQRNVLLSLINRKINRSVVFCNVGMT